MADIEAARACLRAAPRTTLWAEEYDCVLGGMRWVSSADVCPVADLRGEFIPELPEAAAREGIPFLATPRDRDGREKVVLMSAPPDLVRQFLNGDLVPGLVDLYGDPARGFAGGYGA